MHGYDVAFKLVLQSVDVAMRELTGTTVAHWLNVELPEVKNTRVDLLGESPTGELVHIELQASNDSRMALRMAEYCLRVLRIFERLPHQVLVYIGEEPLRMRAELNGPALRYSYRMVDIRELDGERLLESPLVGDNIVAILGRLRNPKAAVRRVVARIAELPEEQRRDALQQLVILAGLRDLGKTVEEEARKMPILIDIINHDLLGPEYKRGLQEGVERGREQGIEQGREQGIEQGVQQGELRVVRRQIEKRFGSIPNWLDERLTDLSPVELEELGLRLLESATIEELFR